MLQSSPKENSPELGVVEMIHVRSLRLTERHLQTLVQGFWEVEVDHCRHQRYDSENCL